ncbi:hypothetical protein V2J09_002136 [Rumex salicifolius]
MIYDVNSPLFRSFLSQKGGASDKRKTDEQRPMQKPKANENKPYHTAKGYKQKVKDIIQGALFPEAGLDKKVGHGGGTGGLVIVRDMDYFSYCESCLLPFQVKCHVGYVPSGRRVVGLSKLSRVADVLAKRLQNPHRLADEIGLALHNAINPAGMAVVLQCLHINLPSQESMFFEPFAANNGWDEILVSSGSGVFEDKKNGV